MNALFITAITVLAIFGAPIFAVMIAFTVLGSHAADPHHPMQALASFIDNVVGLADKSESNSLATIPLFTFMGYVLAESKTADRLVSCAKAVVGWFPGGLAIVTIGVCALFTTVTGASGVTIVAVGGLVLPALLKEGYRERFSLGLVTGTGSIGLLFPPALPLIIFGIIYGLAAQAAATSAAGDSLTLVSFSLDRFLLAGIIPGLVLISMIAYYCIYVAIRDNVPRTPFVLEDAIKTTLRALPELLIPLVMMIMLAKGFQVPEAAAMTTLYVVLLETLGFRDIGIKHIPRIVRESTRLVGAIFILIIAATALSAFFVQKKIPDLMTDWIVKEFHSKVSFLLALNVLLLLVGCVMDIFSALLIIVPLIVQPAAAFHIDPYQLGIIFLVNLEIGYVHPPVGLNLFISSFRFRKPMTELYWAIVPYLLIMFGALVLVTYVPSLTPIKSKAKESKSSTTAPPKNAPGMPDRGVNDVKIDMKDAGMWTIAHCDGIEDAIDQANCRNMFKYWPKCEALDNPLDKLDCENAAKNGDNPFAADAGK
jgi:tripartite ATP-independent transporter DctM subunit